MNKQRGEVAVRLNGHEYTMRPTFEALVEIEERLGAGLVPIARRFVDAQFGVREVSGILAAGIRGGGEKVPANLGELIVRQGVLSFSDAIGTFLTGALQGDSAGKPEAPAGDQK